MSVSSSQRRKNISATLQRSAVVWLEKFARKSGRSKSRLIEEGVKLLQEKVVAEEAASLDQMIEQGVQRILVSQPDEIDNAEPRHDVRFPDEYL